MPVCCPATQVTFNEAVTTVTYPGPEVPGVQVFYLVDGEYVAAGVLTNISYTGSQIIIDHGGITRGIAHIR